MYLSGYSACVQLHTTSLNLARLTIGPMLAKSIQTGELLPPEAAEIVRLLKLFFFLAAEHLRSSDGSASWEWCQHIAYSFATDEEIEELVREHGIFQSGDNRRDVLGTSAAERNKKIRAPDVAPAIPGTRLRAVATDIGSNGKMIDTLTFLKENKAAGKKKIMKVVRSIGSEAESEDVDNEAGSRAASYKALRSPSKANLQEGYNGTTSTHDLLGASMHQFIVDPTRAKPSKVIMWLNTLVLDIERRAAMPSEPGGFMKMAVVGQLNGLITHFMALYKVDTMALPMPYNQAWATDA